MSGPSGIVRIALPSNSSVLVSVPFQPFEARLGQFLSGQLTGESNAIDADRVFLWDADAQEYVELLKGAGTNADAHWFTTNGVESTQTVALGEGFWIANRHGDQNVYLLGAVPLDETQQRVFSEGLSLFGNSYPSPLDLNAAGLKEAGAHGATNAAAADHVLDSAGRVHWLLDKPGDANDGKWLDETGGVACTSLSAGRGFWYERVVTNALWWTLARPYSNEFSAGTNIPQILSMQLESNAALLVMTIGCSGATGETIEIFSKDVNESTPLATEGGWAVAGEGLTSSGATELVWNDSGSDGRSSITGVFCRLYLVGRQDVDTDGDDLSDARERFVHDTDPSTADTDGDAVNDGMEVGRGTSPTNSQSANVTLYADKAIGNNSYDGLTPTVNGGHGPKEGVQAAVNASISGDTVEVASGTYEEPEISPGSKSLTIRPVNHVTIK